MKCVFARSSYYNKVISHLKTKPVSKWTKLRNSVEPNILIKLGKLAKLVFTDVHIENDRVIIPNFYIDKEGWINSLFDDTIPLVNILTIPPEFWVELLSKNIVYCTI